MSSFKLSFVGDMTFVQENSSSDDKCQDTADGMTGDSLLRHPAHVPGSLPASLPYYLFTVDLNGNLEI